jgi:hypothetical protein
MRWNGTTWKRTPSPSPTGDALLTGVAVISARSAWAVGFSEGVVPLTLTLHWNGSVWKRVPSPNPPDGAILNGVTATSPRSAWAVGYTVDGKSLILRWNGAVWTRVPSPSPGSGPVLNGVAATSANRAWVVGYTGSGKTLRTLALRWNGTAWKQVATPAGHSILQSVAATSGDTWAVGLTGPDLIAACGGAGLPAIAGRAAVAGRTAVASPAAQTLILRWNGSGWKRVPSPKPAGGSALFGVATSGTHSAWAVGLRTNSLITGKTLIVRWNGTAWK